MISTEEIQKLADLARLSITEEEKKDLQKDIEGILAYVDQIKNIKGGEVKSEPTLLNVMRDDRVTNNKGQYTEVLVKAAPKSQGNFVKVKKIL